MLLQKSESEVLKSALNCNPFVKVKFEWVEDYRQFKRTYSNWNLEDPDILVIKSPGDLVFDSSNAVLEKAFTPPPP